MNNKFTLQELDWLSWLPILDIDNATEQQLTILKESNAKALTSDYYRLLIIQPDILQQRSIAFNDIMYGKGGASFAERELAAVVTSRVNGCPYCASVHANRFKKESNNEDVMQQILFEDNIEKAGIDKRENTIISFSVKLTESPHLINQKDIEQLVVVGLKLDEIMDILHASSLFSWANRLMLSLGQSQQVCLL